MNIFTISNIFFDLIFNFDFINNNDMKNYNFHHFYLSVNSFILDLFHKKIRGKFQFQDFRRKLISDKSSLKLLIMAETVSKLRKIVLDVKPPRILIDRLTEIPIMSDGLVDRLVKATTREEGIAISEDVKKEQVNRVSFIRKRLLTWSVKNRPPRLTRSSPTSSSATTRLWTWVKIWWPL